MPQGATEQRASSRQARTFVTLDGIRGVAALCVMIFHFRLNPALFPMGVIAVDIFFCLSGFVICHAYLQRITEGLTGTEFLLIRVIRLYPMYILGTILGAAFVVLYAFQANEHVGAARILYSAALASVFLPTFHPVIVSGLEGNYLFPFDLPAWSLFLELAVNLLFFVFRPRAFLLGLMLLLSLVYLADTTLYFGAAGAGWGDHNVVGGVPRALFGFYSGFALYGLWRSGVLPQVTLGRTLTPLCAALFCALPNKPMIFIMLIPVVPLFIALGISNPRSAHVTWAFEILGEISYPLYAIHVPILYLATLAWNSTHGLPLSPLTTPLPFGAKLILVMLLPPAALLLSRIYDQPARRLLTRAARTMTAAR